MIAHHEPFEDLIKSEATSAFVAFSKRRSLCIFVRKPAELPITEKRIYELIRPIEARVSRETL